jgi:hypothetical protein
MNVYFWGLLAACCAVTAEAIYRAHVGTPWGTPGIMLLGIVCAMGVNIGIWGITQSTPLVGMSLVFSVWTAAIRLGYTLYVGDEVSRGTWYGFGIMLLAELVRAIVK